MLQAKRPGGGAMFWRGIIWLAMVIALPTGVTAQTLDPLYEFTQFQGYQNGPALANERIYGVATGGTITPGTIFELTAPAIRGQHWKGVR